MDGSEAGATGTGAQCVHTDAVAWKDFSEATGVSYKLLRRHADSTGSTLLLLFAPNSSYPAHRHPAGEEYFILEGALEDGDRSYQAGDYVYYPPGSVHRPASREGCLVLVMLPARVEPV